VVEKVVEKVDERVVVKERALDQLVTSVERLVTLQGTALPARLLQVLVEVEEVFATTVDQEATLQESAVDLTIQIASDVDQLVTLQEIAHRREPTLEIATSVHRQVTLQGIAPARNR